MQHSLLLSWLFILHKTVRHRTIRSHMHHAGLHDIQIPTSWNSLANLLGISYLWFLNLVGTSYTHLRSLLSETMYLLILEISSLPIRPKRILPILRSQQLGKFLYLSYLVLPRNKWKFWRNVRKHICSRVKTLCLLSCPMPKPPILLSISSKSKKHPLLCQTRKSLKFTIQLSPN